MQTITIGRANNNDIVIQDSAVSKNHLKITKTAQGEYILEDLGSTNGTFVNGKPVRTCKLQSNDIVKIGDTLLPWQNYFHKNYQQANISGNLLHRISIGRANNNDFVINDPTVSSQHAFLEIYDDGNLRIVDNNSTNGTFLQGKRIQTAFISSGESLHLGRAKVNISDIIQNYSAKSSLLKDQAFPAQPAPVVNKSIPAKTQSRFSSWFTVGAIAVVLILIAFLKKTNQSESPQTTKQQQKIENPYKQDNKKEEKALEDTKEHKPNERKYTEQKENNSVADLVELSENAVFMVFTYENGFPKSMGTGFFISNSGLAVSNHHVFSPGNEWRIKLKNGDIYNVKRIVESNADLDYVIFETDAQEVTSLPVASSNPRKGEDIIVIGNPQGFELSVTKGVVSGLRNYDKYTGSASEGDTYLQIDAAISSGNSGGPVLNLKGEVVGIATMIHSGASGITQNINLALNIQKLPLPH